MYCYQMSAHLFAVAYSASGINAGSFTGFKAIAFPVLIDPAPCKRAQIQLVKVEEIGLARVEMRQPLLLRDAASSDRT
jgi:hypothetical protein